MLHPRHLPHCDASRAEEPKQWLEDFDIRIRLLTGTRTTAMQCLSLYLADSARAWMRGLPAESIRTWSELYMKFTKTFAATYKRPANIEELRACTQKKGESICSYISRWTNIHNAAEGVSEERAINAFVAGVSREDLKEELRRLGPGSITHLMEIANK